MAAAAGADNVRRIDDVPKFTTQPKDKSKRARAAFELDGVELWLRRPKNSLALQMLSAARGEGFSTDSERAKDYLTLVTQFIGYIEEEAPEQVLKAGKPTGEQQLRGRAWVLHRLGDPEDDLDIQDLGPAIEQLLEKMFEDQRRPTGGPSASGARPSRSSRAGGAGTRTRRAKTS